MGAGMEEGAESKWELLPSELLCLVLSLLPLSGLIRSAFICKRWRHSADEAYDDGHRSDSLPWLWGKDSPDFYSLPDRRSYHLDLPVEMLEGPPYGAGVSAIHVDWFVVSTYSSSSSVYVVVDTADKDNSSYLYFLCNPFSRAQIDLPPIHIYFLPRHFNDPYPRFAFSRNPGDQECVAAFFRHPKEGIGFYNLGAAAAGREGCEVG